MPYVVLKRSSIDELGSQMLAQMFEEKCRLHETYNLNWLDDDFLKHAWLIVSYSGDVVEFAADILALHCMRQRITWRDNSGLCIVMSDNVVDTLGIQERMKDLLFYITEFIGRECFYSLSSAKTWFPKLLSHAPDNLPDNLEAKQRNFGRTGMPVIFRGSQEGKTGSLAIELFLESRDVFIVSDEILKDLRAGEVAHEEPCLLILYAHEDVDIASGLLYIHNLRMQGLLRNRDVVLLILGNLVAERYREDLFLSSMVRLLSIDVVTTLELALERVLPSVLNDVLGR